jgi:XTP/dITP diphosphohydrolase
MVKAYRIGEKAAAVGFDWQKREDVWDKVKEELMEVDAEIEAKNMECLTDEIGDLFFALINACRLYGIDPEGALERTNKKFIRRFGHVEQRAEERGVTLRELSLEEMDGYWNEAKQNEK